MRSCSLPVALSFVLSLSLAAAAQEKAGDRTVSLGDGKLTLTAPEGWTKKQPRFPGIVDAELEAPAAKGDDTAGRMTGGKLGGPVEDNINRWATQFAGEGGAAAKPKLDKLSFGGAEVQIVDLGGTYKDMPGGPVAGGKAVMRENYRMLAAIIQTKDAGNYFLRLYGPKATIGEAEKGFHEMVKSLKVK
jgi:hypothetical protein